jgi:murein DD-endopeptidase MepM/ murein hydrolase activator NlpD
MHDMDFDYTFLGPDTNDLLLPNLELPASAIDFTPLIPAGAFASTTMFHADMNKVARWDTSAINMYGVDMTAFRFNVEYELQNKAAGKVFTMPVKGAMTSGFGYRRLYGRNFHFGSDLDLETGDPVSAAMDGTVRIARYNKGYGNMVIISHEGGLETLYGHMSQLNVVQGQKVKSGELIGLGGSTGQSTGPHLHFEIRIFGEQIDPEMVIDMATGQLKSETIHVDATWFDHLLDIHDIRYHVVVEGETLQTIAEQYKLEVADIALMNDLDPDAALVAGKRLRLGSAE